MNIVTLMIALMDITDATLFGWLFFYSLHCQILDFCCFELMFIKLFFLLFKELASDVGLDNYNDVSHAALRDPHDNSANSSVQSHMLKSDRRDNRNIVPEVLDNCTLQVAATSSQNVASTNLACASVGDEKPLIQCARQSNGCLSEDLKEPDKSSSCQQQRSASLDVKSPLNASVEGNLFTIKEASHVEQDNFIGSHCTKNRAENSLKYVHKLAADAKNTSPSSSTVSAAAGPKSSLHSVKQRLKVNVNSDCKRENVSTARMPTDEKVKCISVSESKTYTSARNPSSSSVVKHGFGEGKEDHCSSSKSGKRENTGCSDAKEDTGLSRAQGGRIIDNKLATPVLPRKSEKSSQLSSQLSSKVTDLSSMAPATASPALSDEEVCLFAKITRALDFFLCRNFSHFFFVITYNSLHCCCTNNLIALLESQESRACVRLVT